MRLMDNDELSPDQIEEVKDDVEFYLETSDDIEAIEAFGGDTYDFYEVSDKTEGQPVCRADVLAPFVSTSYFSACPTAPSRFWRWIA
jgi:CCR4-NOT transcriptional regulation complex NOT5 subunit